MTEEEKPLSLAQWKKANPDVVKYVAPRYKRYRKEWFSSHRKKETTEGDKVGIVEDMVQQFAKSPVLPIDEPLPVVAPPKADIVLLKEKYAQETKITKDALRKLQPLLVGTNVPDATVDYLEAAWDHLLVAEKIVPFIVDNFEKNIVAAEETLKADEKRKESAEKLNKKLSKLKEKFAE